MGVMAKPESFDRTDVIEKVTKVFWTKGYNGTSMQDIVDATGLNRSSIYNSFGDKHSLYLDTLKHYKKQTQSASLASVINKTPKLAIRSLFESVLTDVDAKQGEIGCYITNCTAELSNMDKTTADFLADNLDDMIDMFTNLIEAGKQTGEFKSDLDSKATALYLFTNLQGLKLTGMLVKSKEKISAVIDKVLEEL